MNTDTGRIYSGLSEPVVTAIAERNFEMLQEESAALFQSMSVDEQEALLDARAGARIVPVSGEVAQQVQLGQRELQRRRRRAKAARQARKRNR